MSSGVEAGASGPEQREYGAVQAQPGEVKLPKSCWRPYLDPRYTRSYSTFLITWMVLTLLLGLSLTMQSFKPVEEGSDERMLPADIGFGAMIALHVYGIIFQVWGYNRWHDRNSANLYSDDDPSYQSSKFMHVNGRRRVAYGFYFVYLAHVIAGFSYLFLRFFSVSIEKIPARTQIITWWVGYLILNAATGALLRARADGQDDISHAMGTVQATQEVIATNSYIEVGGENMPFLKLGTGFRVAHEKNRVNQVRAQRYLKHFMYASAFSCLLQVVKYAVKQEDKLAFELITGGYCVALSVANVGFIAYIVKNEAGWEWRRPMCLGGD